EIDGCSCWNLEGCGDSFSCSLLTAHFSLLSNLHQLGPGDEFRTDSLIEFVRPTAFGIDPGKAAAHGRVVGLRVDGTDIVPQKDAAAASHPGSPLAPASPIDHRAAVRPADRRSLGVAQGHPVGAASRTMRTGIAG